MSGPVREPVEAGGAVVDSSAEGVDEIAWQPFREPLRRTLVRTGVIAVVGGAVLASRWGKVKYWALGTLLMLWFSLGGHWVEIFFLNSLRPRLSGARGVQVAARLVVWFVGGVVLGVGMKWTAILIGADWAGRWMAWWVGGVVFIGIELVVHLVMWGRGIGNFYDGRG